MKRQGFTLVETAAAVVLMAVAATLCVQMLMLNASTRRAADQRRLATRELSNVMERLMAFPDERLTPEAVKNIDLSPEVRASLPEPRFDVELEEQADEQPTATRVTLTLVWRGPAGQDVRPVRLVAWYYGAKEAKP